MTSQLGDYWPSREAIGKVIRTEAETFDKSVFLAVHQPMKFDVVTVGGDDGTSKTEEDLYDDFLEKDPPSGTKILLIRGASGVGKSHVVVWLDAQMKHREDDEKRHIIRIPKGSSLRDVLGKVLEGLEGPKYEKHKETLRTAKGQLTREHSAGYLQINIQTALQERAKVSEDVKEKTFAARLPAIIGDQHLWDHWFNKDGNGPIAQLAQRVTERAKDLEDERKHGFELEDLKFADHISLRDLSRDARNFYAQIQHDDENLRYAVEVLNEVLDDATRRLFKLGSADELNNLFKDVRESLLAEGRELVLLIEDFAVLSGIQGALVQAMIHHGIEDGKQKFCTMRTAVAVTPGYPLPETLTTRAVYEWKIEERVPDVLERSVELVGSYLNAARIGIERLEDSLDEPGAVKTFEVDNPEDELSDYLDAFGRSNKGYPLFPLNEHAIKGFLDEGSVEQGEAIYNPRKILNHVLRVPLLARDHFEKKDFPPRSLGTHTLINADLTQIAQALAEANGSNHRAVDRYLKIIAYWGGQPTTKEEAAGLNKLVFKAFGLESLDLGVAPPIRPPIDTPPTPTPTTTEIDRWQTKLEQWRVDTVLTQQDANIIRKAIAAAVVGSLPIDWPGLPRVKPENLMSFRHIYVPGTTAHKPDDPLITLCSEEERTHPIKGAQVQKELQAVLKFDVKKSWDFEGGEDASALYGAFLTKHTGQAVAWLRERPLTTSHTENGVMALSESLLTGAVSLGLTGRRSSLSGAVEALFVMGEPPLGRREDRWSDIQQNLYDIRKDSAEILLRVIGAKQGYGAVIQAIDITQISPHLESFRNDWDFGGDIPEDPSDAQIRKVRKGYGDLRRNLAGAVEEQVTKVQHWDTKVRDWLGEDFNGKTLDEALREMLTKALANGMDGGRIDSLRRKAGNFRDASVQDSLNSSERIKDDSLSWATLAELGKQDQGTMDLVEEVVDDFTRFIQEALNHIQEKRRRLGPDIEGDARATLVTELEGIKTLVESLQRGQE